MRRTLAVAACVFAILGMLAPPVFAQAPAPKVTITGLFDQVTSIEKNVSEGNFTRDHDTDWYARTRFRPDFVFEVGRTKAVLGFELDLTYGQTGFFGGGPGKSANATGNSAQLGVTSDLGLNTDTAGIIEIKWIYTEFDLTGPGSLLPFIPVPSVARAGGQPFASLATIKSCVFACGDFAGVSFITTFAPNLKTDVAYVMVENETGSRKRGIEVNRLTRGNDYSFIGSVDLSPFKGLDIKPLYSFFHAEGITSTTARRPVANLRTAGGFINSAASFGASALPAPAAGTLIAATTGSGNPSLAENRHTVGFDARWRSGPFGLEPTILYQIGRRDAIGLQSAGDSAVDTADMSAWLADIIASFQAGPFLLEVRGMYTTGNKARDDLNKRVRYFEPLSTDTGYWNTWGGIVALNGTDYVPGLGQPGGMATSVGYDRYGRIAFGVRGTYSLTPKLDIFGLVTPNWSAQKVDTDSRADTRVHVTGDMKGDSRYIGTEGDIGFTYRFAPNVDFEMQGQYLWSGHALDGMEVQNGAFVKKDAKDAYAISSRIRLQF